MLPAEEVFEQRSELLDRTLDLDKTCRIALALLEQKPNALDQAAPLAGWMPRSTFFAFRPRTSVA